jgi:uncharacterized protein (DUF983 family)
MLLLLRKKNTIGVFLIKNLQMLKKGSKLNSILTGSCPNCHKESMYINKNPYILSKVFKMHEHCSHCNTKYKIEPSFFYGAMYVSYGLGVAIGIFVYLILNFIFHANLKEIFISIIISLVVLMPISIRLSRNIWINIFISYGSKNSVR